MQRRLMFLVKDTAILLLTKENFVNFKRKYRAVFAVLLFLLLGVLIFRDFVFRDKLLLYTDTGSDSVNDTYPIYLHLSDYLRTNGLPLWSFAIGMGQSLSPQVGSLLFDPVVWLPRKTIAYALVYQHFFKVVLVGILFLKFLELRGLNFRSSLLGALLLALSAYMCMGSCWTSLGNEVVCFAFLLFSIEYALARSRWIFIPFAVACLGVLTPFHLYLCALVLSLYVPARLVELNGWKRVPNLRACVQIGAVALIGVGLAAVVWLDSAASILNSPRGLSATSYVSKLWSFPAFGFESRIHYLTAVLRFFSNDMVGTANSFRGWHNYLEAPIGYCGLLCLVMLPQVFVGVGSRQRVLYALFLCLIILPTVFPWFRYTFWLFEGDYYRTFSLFSVFIVITLSMTALFRYVEQGILSVRALVMTLFVLLAVLHLPIQRIPPGTRKEVTILLLAYSALLVIGRYFRREAICSWALIGLCAVELCHFDRITVSDRSTVTKSELRERIGYNDYTVDAVRDIKSQDKGFYRITKVYFSSPATHVSLNDALVFGYYGTASYSSFNNLNYIHFLMGTNVIPRNASEDLTRWVKGTLDRPKLGAFACEKYVLTTDAYLIDPTYEAINSYNYVHVFRNKMFLPLGLFCTEYLPEDSFEKLSTSAKEDVLRRSVVLSKTDLGAANRLSAFTLDEPSEGVRDIKSLQLRSFSENRIEGSIQCEKAGVLVFQFPFDPGWKIQIDGANANAIKVDVGLLGVVLPEGEHHVELRFRPAHYLLGMLLGLISSVTFVVSLWHWPKISFVPAV